MTTAEVLYKEKIVSLSELQKNPSRALDAKIVRIVKNGKEIGIFLKREEFENLFVEKIPLKKDFKKNLSEAVKRSYKGTKPLDELLR